MAHCERSTRAVQSAEGALQNTHTRGGQGSENDLESFANATVAGGSSTSNCGRGGWLQVYERLENAYADDGAHTGTCVRWDTKFTNDDNMAAILLS